MTKLKLLPDALIAAAMLAVLQWLGRIIRTGGTLQNAPMTAPRPARVALTDISANRFRA